VLSGARSDCFVIETDQQERVAGIQFLPGGAFPFLRMPSSETEGIIIDLDDLWRGRAAELLERLLAAPSVESMFLILERCLMAQLVRPLELHPAVRYGIERFQQPGSAERVSDVIECVGLSSRRFIELFHAEVGLTPKAFSRVRRFQNVLQTIRQRRETNWADIALDCGYYDQAHFIHDFRSFSGFTPNEYMAKATPHINHIPLV
jgi:AraC-like DNA-binding protein